MENNRRGETLVRGGGTRKKTNMSTLLLLLLLGLGREGKSPT